MSETEHASVALTDNASAANSVTPNQANEDGPDEEATEVDAEIAAVTKTPSVTLKYAGEEEAPSVYADVVATADVSPAKPPDYEETEETPHFHEPFFYAKWLMNYPKTMFGE